MRSLFGPIILITLLGKILAILEQLGGVNTTTQG